MTDSQVTRVFVQSGAGQEWTIGSTCSIGRAEENDIILNDDKVSRRHALIHRQDDRSYYIIDLGSGNGTYLNARRLTMPTALKNEDRIQIARQTLTFFDSAQPPQTTVQRVQAPNETIIDIREQRVWLMLGDLIGSSRLTAQLQPEEAARFVGRWLSECGAIVDGCEGAINKYLGDGFLAYWADEPAAPSRIIKSLQRFTRLKQDNANLHFRIVVHHGSITSGGAGSLAEESLMGLDVNYIFRMEKLAARQRETLLFSQPACAQLAGSVRVRSIGRHELEGFDLQPPPEFFAPA